MASPSRSLSAHNGHEWIRCLCLVNFDLVEGPRVVETWPEGALSSEEAPVLARISFPDFAPQGWHEEAYMLRYCIGGAWTHGAALFRREWDEASARNQGAQCVICVLSFLAFFGLLASLARTAAEAIATGGGLHELLSCIRAWPAPSELQSRAAWLPLPRYARLLFWRPPEEENDSPLSPLPPLSPPRPCSVWDEAAVFDSQPLDHVARGACAVMPEEEACCRGHGRYGDWNPFCFGEKLELLWSCWELLLAGESLLILGEGPAQASDCALALATLLGPLPLLAEERAGDGGLDLQPHFTVYDAHFQRLRATLASSDTCQMSGMLLGTANPIFRQKPFDNFPYTLDLSEAAPTSPLGPVRELLRGVSGLTSCDGLKRGSLAKYVPGVLRQSPEILGELARIAASGGDDEEVKRAAAQLLLRGHFSEILRNLLEPLKTLFAASYELPVVGMEEAWLQEQNLQPVGRFAEPFCSRSAALALYAALLRGPFGPWLSQYLWSISQHDDVTSTPTSTPSGIFSCVTPNSRRQMGVFL
ncbi:unnamed protein product [Polarella glacialis]|uniref:UDENN domain-containing protein n=1 Tax=Polarella glacialis TaxID=89957 RepID=A0A813L2E2_POLGL|nr:unnamed protein product [Polarella glacialis]